MTSHRPSSLASDLRAAVRRRANAAGSVLAPSTVDELAAHLEDIYSDAVDGGASHADAWTLTVSALDGDDWTTLTRSRHAVREATHARVGDTLAVASTGRSIHVFDAIRLALRQLRQHPAFAAITIAVLGLGTGAATAVFTVVDSVVLKPLPYTEPDRLVTLWDTNSDRGISHDPISPVNFMDYRALPLVKDAAAWWRPGVNLTEPGADPLRVKTIETSANLFEVLGVGPQVGPGFPQGGPLFDRDRIAVISDALWRSRYGADPTVIGRNILLNNAAYRVVGVMPPKFHFPDDVDVWQRLQWDMTQHSREAHFMEAVLRLDGETSVEAAQAAVDTLAARLQKDFSSTNAGWGARLVPLLDERLGFYRPALFVLFGAVGLLLAIGILNVASLLLTRALAREREIALRMAVGASPRHLVMQLIAESLVLSIGGVITGVAAVYAALPLLKALTPVTIPRLEDAAVDVRALALSLAVVVVTTIVFGLVPALVLLSRKSGDALRSGERGASRPARRIYSALVTAEIALACALLASSALLVRSVTRMIETPLGVEADGTLMTTVQVQHEGRRLTLDSWRAVADTHQRLLETLRQQPGVRAAGAANFMPMGVGWRNPVMIDGQPFPERQEDAPRAQMHSVSEGYLEAMGATVRLGRSFGESDSRDSPAVVVVNETFARRHLADGALGRRVRMWASGIGPLGLNLKAPPAITHDGVLFDVVGVVADIRNTALGQAIEPAVYFSSRQFPFAEMHIAVAASDRSAARTALLAAMRAATPTVPPGVLQTWGERFEARTAESRLLMSVLLAFAALAAGLAALGIYGLFSWSVAVRTRELAIRLALGARPERVGASVVAHSGALILSGLAVGFVIVRMAEALLVRVLFEVSPVDLTALAAAGAALTAGALLACVPAALKAMRVDPVVGLRVE
jgi:putative ABC transport system permease protein